MRAIGNVCYDLQQRSHTRSISTRGRAIKNNWRISIARAIVGNRATNGSDQRPVYDQSRRPATDGTINRGVQRSIARSIVASCDRSYHHQSWHQTIYNHRIEVLNMTTTLLRFILSWRSPTTSATCRTFFLRFTHDSNIFRSQVGRNLVLSPV